MTIAHEMPGELSLKRMGKKNNNYGIKKKKRKKKRMVDEGEREKEVPRRRRNGLKLRCFPAQEDASVYTQKAVPGIISICRAFMLCSEQMHEPVFLRLLVTVTS